MGISGSQNGGTVPYFWLYFVVPEMAIDHFCLSMFSKGTTAVTVPALTLKIHWRVRSLKGLRAKAR